MTIMDGAIQEAAVSERNHEQHVVKQNTDRTHHFSKTRPILRYNNTTVAKTMTIRRLRLIVSYWLCEDGLLLPIIVVETADVNVLLVQIKID